MDKYQKEALAIFKKIGPKTKVGVSLTPFKFGTPASHNREYTRIYNQVVKTRKVK